MIFSYQREWAEAKRELQEERDNVRTLTVDREHTIKNAMKQVEEMGKELADALRAVAAAESRAAVAEVFISFQFYLFFILKTSLCYSSASLNLKPYCYLQF